MDLSALERVLDQQNESEARYRIHWKPKRRTSPGDTSIYAWECRECGYTWKVYQNPCDCPNVPFPTIDWRKESSSVYTSSCERFRLKKEESARWVVYWWGGREVTYSLSNAKDRARVLLRSFNYEVERLKRERGITTDEEAPSVL